MSLLFVLAIFLVFGLLKMKRQAKRRAAGPVKRSPPRTPDRLVGQLPPRRPK